MTLRWGKPKTETVALEDKAFKDLNNSATELEAKETIAHLRKRVAEREAAFQTMLADRGKYRDLMKQVTDAVIAAEPFPPIPYKAGDPSGSPIALVIKASDWQTGEIVLASETEGFGEFNWEIEQKMIDFLGDKLIDYVKGMRSIYNIKEVFVLCEGDFVSGGHNMHEEDLGVTNEFPAPVQATNAGLLLGEFIHKLQPHFVKVNVVEMGADNHGRTTRKIRSKNADTDNWNHVVYAVANEKISRLSNVFVQRISGTKGIALINGKRVLVSHGHEVKAFMGTPYYALDRLAGREAQKRRNQPDKQFDYISCGHWHVPAILNNQILINGALTGTTEFDHMVGRSAPPAQVSFLMHPRYGVFNWTPWQFPGKTGWK